jgi:peptide/nickel transport system permease protein
MIRPTFWQRFAASRVGVVGLAVLLVVLLVALSAPILFPGDPFAIVGRPFQPPSAAHPFGTDSLGRDMATCLAHGAFTSLTIGVIATSVALMIGTLMGAFAGFYGGLVDNVLMRVTELFQTIPSFIFAIVLVAILSPSLTSTVIAIAVVSWPPIARLVRGEFMTLRRREYVEAAIVLGMGDLQTIFRQILPNCASPIIVTGSLLIATAILIESALAFLGLGDSNVMSWGFMIGSGRTYLRSAWWLCAIPGFAILMTVLAINLVGEGLNDALNPRLRTL